MSLALPAVADSIRQINVPAGDLVQALESLARQLDVSIVYQAPQLAGLKTHGVSGKLTSQEAVKKLLEGTSLTVNVDSTGAMLISTPRQSGAAVSHDSGAERDDTAAGGRNQRVSLEEIVVTAQRREQMVIDVPIAVSVVGGSELHARGATNLRDVQYAVPGLSVLDFSPGQERVQLRGVSSGNGLPTVGRYLDEMNINGDAVALGFDLRLYDMDRIEVLRGPQPTLYGESSMGGTLHYVTVKPNLTEFGGYVEGEGGAQADGAGVYRIDGAVNLPIVPGQLAARIVGGYDHSGGWIDNTATARQDQNSDAIKTARATLLWQPVEGLSVSLLGLHQDTDDADQNFGLRERTNSNLVPNLFAEHVNLGNLVVSYDAGAITLLSSTGYYERRFRTAVDVSGLLVPVLPLFGLPPGFVTTVGLQGPSVERNVTQELRLVSNDSGPLHYLFGATFRRYRLNSSAGTSTAPNSLPFQLLASTNQDGSTSESAYGEISYALVSGFEALAGLRYFHDKRTVDDTATSFGLTPPPELHEAEFHSLNPRFNLLYHLGTDGIVYFNAAKGFRSGGFNTTASAQTGGAQLPTSFSPEDLWTYELGAKQEFLGRRLIVEAAAYYNQWDNLQTQVFAAGAPITVTTNGGKASGPGFDLTLTGKPAGGLTLAGTVGLNRMRYRADTLQHLDGDHIDYTADLTYSLSADYHRALTQRVTGFMRIDFQHSSPLYFTERNLAAAGLLRSDHQNALNIRLGAELRSVEAYLFVNNATDWDGVIMPGVANTPPPVLPRPRTAGVGFKVSF
jgi:outer membrane receptor protein involved in Fe transport